MYHTLQEKPVVWDLFSRREEYSATIRDSWDRFPYYASGYRRVFEPLASRHLFERGNDIEYPDEKPFALCITHDIDVVYQNAPTKILSAVSSLKKRNVSDTVMYISQLLTRRYPRCNFQDILNYEEGYGACSTFFFLALEKNNLDYAYSIEDLETDIGSIADRGCEIGLHGGDTSYIDREQVLSQKERLERVLNKKVSGYRSHMLKMRVPETWNILESTGFKYDSTLGYADCVGFRNGMCHPFRPFDLEANREIKIFEIPLVIMDNTLDSYMKLNLQDAWRMAKQLIDTVEQYRGVITVLWHNTSFLDQRFKLFKKILQYCSDKNAWMPTAQEICEWYETNNMWTPKEKNTEGHDVW